MNAGGQLPSSFSPLYSVQDPGPWDGTTYSCGESSFPSETSGNALQELPGRGSQETANAIPLTVNSEVTVLEGEAVGGGADETSAPPGYRSGQTLLICLTHLPGC